MIPLPGTLIHSMSGYREKGRVFQLDNGEQYYINVYWHKGGMSYIIGEVIKRGYWCSILPVKFSQKMGYTVMETGAFTGGRLLLEEATRYNSKRLEYLIEGIVSGDTGNRLPYDYVMRTFLGGKKDETN